MYCPMCGQQQPSEGIRFCPKCGFSLAGVSALVSGSDAIAAGAGPAPMPEQSAKRVGIKRGARFMFFSVLLTPVFIGLTVMFNAPVLLFVPMALFLAGLLWTLYSALFGEELLPVRSLASLRGLRGGKDNARLGAAQFAPAPLFNQQRVNTAEIVPPPSVTENTTKLLD